MNIWTSQIPILIALNPKIMGIKGMGIREVQVDIQQDEGLITKPQDLGIPPPSNIFMLFRSLKLRSEAGTSGLGFQVGVYRVMQP